MNAINVGIIGVGNCSSGLIQGLEYYKNSGKSPIGLMHKLIGGYGISDIVFSSAFDISSDKIGKPLSSAIYAEPNLVKWTPNVSNCEVLVAESPILDGIGIYVEKKISAITQEKSVSQIRENILAELKTTNTEVLLNYLPVGSQKATEFWADVALEAGCGLINCMPVFIASNNVWAKKFEERGLPIIGDDVKSVVGATIVHRALARLCSDRGTEIDQTYQINVGGNTDFLNMKEAERLESKKISKTEAVQSIMPERITDEKIYIGPSDFIPQLENTKLAFIRIKGKMFADVPFNLELRLEVDDKANSAGVAIDAIRCCKIAKERGSGGPLIEASAWLMKHPPKQMDDPSAKKALESWINLV